MTTYRSNMKAAMSRKTSQTASSLFRLTSIALLTMSCWAGSVSYAQEPAQNTADLNFVAADIEAVVKAIGHYTNSTFIIDPRVKGQITLVSEKPLTKDQAFKLLTSTLRLQGYSVVKSDGYYKVVPEADAKVQPGPTHTQGSARAESAKGDQIVTQIYKLNYESAANVIAVLRPLISPNNTINANPGNNSIVITDYADNLKRLNAVIESIDVPSMADMDVIPIRHAIASDIATLVNKISDGGSSGPGDAVRAQLLADPRTNSILLKAPSQARASQLKSLIGKLDQPTALPGNVHVVYLKNAEAVKLAQTLRSIVSGDSTLPQSSSGLSANAGSSSGSGSGSSGSSFSLNNNSQGNTTGVTQTAGSSGSSSGGGASGFIQADAATNTLIITASEAVYKNLRNVIDQLDARRAQVYVEALIVEMSVTDAAEMGVQWLALSGNSNSAYRVGGGTAFASGTGNNIVSLATATTPTPTDGMTLGLFRQINGKLSLGAVAHLLESKGNANILSMPNLVTLDNEEAKIVVGQNVPFITGQFTTSTSTGSAGVNPFQTIERKEIGLKLTIKPQISEGGTVKLAIFQESSSIDNSVATTSSSGIVTKLRSISTNVLVEDGQILALGGLIEDTKSTTDEQVPGLGSLPLVGNLFKYKSTNGGKTNLMVFLRPTVVRSSDQSIDISADRYDYMRTKVAPASGFSSGAADMLQKGRLMQSPMAVQAPQAPAAASKAESGVTEGQ